MDKIIYYNRNGVKKLILNEYPYYTSEAPFRSWEYSYDEVMGAYSNFRRAKQPYNLRIIVTSEVLSDRDNLCHVFEEDVSKGQAGTLEIRGWKMKCFIKKGKHIFSNHPKEYVLEFEVVTDNAVWTREQTYSYNSGSSGGSTEDLHRDYTYESSLLGRPYDYGYSVVESNNAELNIDSDDNGYKMLIYGAQTNPVVYINNHPIKVNVEISEQERLQIISNIDEKTIKILSSAGAETDAFLYRDKEYTPFISLESHNEISFSDIRFDLTVIERRSDPPWN